MTFGDLQLHTGICRVAKIIRKNCAEVIEAS
jgi:hypothetical protein